MHFFKAVAEHEDPEGEYLRIGLVGPSVDVELAKGRDRSAMPAAMIHGVNSKYIH